MAGQTRLVMCVGWYFQVAAGDRETVWIVESINRQRQQTASTDSDMGDEVVKGLTRERHDE